MTEKITTCAFDLFTIYSLVGVFMFVMLMFYRRREAGDPDQMSVAIALRLALIWPWFVISLWWQSMRDYDGR